MSVEAVSQKTYQKLGSIRPLGLGLLPRCIFLNLKSETLLLGQALCWGATGFESALQVFKRRTEVPRAKFSQP